MRNLKLLVCGDRNWTEVQIIHDWLSAFNKSDEWLEITLVHGAAKGADSIAGEIAKSFAWNVKPYPAEWDKYGKAAGPIRNRQMLKENPDIDIVLGFHTNLKESKGTKDMLILAIQEGIEMHLITGR